LLIDIFNALRRKEYQVSVGFEQGVKFARNNFAGAMIVKAEKVY